MTADERRPNSATSNKSTDAEQTPDRGALGERITFDVATGAKRIGKSENWYLKRLRSGEFPGHKFGRVWRLTEGDVAQAIALMARPALPKAPTAGLTPRSLQRARRRLET